MNHLFVGFRLQIAPFINHTFFASFARGILNSFLIRSCGRIRAGPDYYSLPLRPEEKWVRTWAATCPASSLRRSVWLQALVDQGDTFLRSSLNLKFFSLLCRNFRMFQGRSLWPSIRGTSWSRRVANSKRSSKEALELIFKAIGTPTPAAAASSSTVTIIHQCRVVSSIPENKTTIRVR